MRKHFCLLSIVLCFASFCLAESFEPGFYDKINGLQDSQLKDTLKSLIRKHTVIEYGSDTWEVFYYSDRNEDGQIMDMYCDEWKTVSTPGQVAAGCNIEHSFAKSWWGGCKNDAYRDCYHLNPSNSVANGSRSNYPLGIPEKNFKTNTGSLKVGMRHHEELNMDHYVFEPKDEYKGDFARAYFYMATCYGHWSNGDHEPVLENCDKKQYYGWRTDNDDVGSMFAMQNDNYLEFQPWEQEVLITWHRQDPVSEKEIKRADAVSDFQHNRNPFIDYPYLAEYIWGEKSGETVDMSTLMASSEPEFIPGVSDGQRNTTDPFITSPRGKMDLGATNIGEENILDMKVKGINLTDGNLTLSISGTDAALFSLATSTVTKAQAETENGYNVTVTYLPTSEGNHSATLTINGCGVSDHQVTLIGTCTAVHTITWSSAEGMQTTKAATGAVPPLPTNTPANCSDDRVFMGWTTNANYSGETEPTDLFSMPSAIDGPKTFYAVYADAERTGSGTPTYTLASSIAAGDLVVIACNTKGQTAGALDNQVLKNTASTFSDDKSTITTVGEGTLIFTIGVTDVGYTLSTEDGALGATAAKKLAFDSGTTNWSINITDGTATITNENSSYGTLQYNAGSPRFTTYTSAQTAIQLYKVTGGTTYSGYSLLCNGDDPTHFNQTVREAAVAEKILINGHLYILRDNVLYDLRGAKVTNR